MHPGPAGACVATLQGRDERPEIRVEAPVHDLVGVQPGERCERWRKLIGTRHRGAVHQHRDRSDLRCQGGLDLDPDEVRGVRQAGTSVGPGRSHPARADHDQDRVGVGDRPPDRLDEILARLDRLDVDEDGVLPEPGDEPIGDPAGVSGGVVAPIADEEAHGVSIA